MDVFARFVSPALSGEDGSISEDEKETFHSAESGEDKTSSVSSSNDGLVVPTAEGTLGGAPEVPSRPALSDDDEEGSASQKTGEQGAATEETMSDSISSSDSSSDGEEDASNEEEETSVEPMELVSKKNPKKTKLKARPRVRVSAPKKPAAKKTGTPATRKRQRTSDKGQRGSRAKAAKLLDSEKKERPKKKKGKKGKPSARKRLIDRNAARAVREAQASTDLKFAEKPFRRLVNDLTIAHRSRHVDPSRDVCRWTKDARRAIQTATEDLAVEIFERTNQVRKLCGATMTADKHFKFGAGIVLDKLKHLTARRENEE